jgi:phosphatidate cytidylyltransferase
LNNFVKRTLTAIVFVGLLLGCTFWSQLSFTILFFIITVVGMREFYSLSEDGGLYPQKLAGTIVGALLFLSSALVSMNIIDAKSLMINLPIVFLFFIVELFSNSKTPFANIAFTLLGLVYVALPFTLLNFITCYNGIYSYHLLFGFFFILWINDTGAYLVGSAIGKHKLFPRVSPGKTWEGAIGGAIASYSVAFFIISEWYNVINRFDWIVIATIMIVIGSLGDLVESLFKRSVNVKDSGSILPGHGGILDRFDSLILATPFVFMYLFVIKS